MKLTLYRLIAALFLLTVTVELPRIPNSGEAASVEGVVLVGQSSDGVSLRLTPGKIELQPVLIDGVPYTQIVLPGSSPIGIPGEPGIPAYHALLGAPDGAAMDVEVSYAKPTEYFLQERLLPVSQALASNSEFEPGQVVFRARPDAYSTESITPAELVNITDDAWLRYQRIIHLEIFPVQYQPAANKILFYSEINVNITFENKIVHSEQIPIQQGDPFERVLAAKLLNYEQASAWRTQPIARDQLDGERALETEPGVKIVVDEDGIYQISYADLVDAGMDPAPVDPRNFQLTNMEEPVAIFIPGEEDGSFDPGDKIIFYGQKFNGERYQEIYPDDRIYWLFDNLGTTAWPGYQYPADVDALVRDAGAHHEKYTRENVYWLRVEPSQGLRMSAINGSPGSAPVAASYLETVRAEQSNNWWSWHFTQEDTWFWERISYVGTTVLTKTYPVDISAPAALSMPATLRANLVAQSYSGTVAPDHHARLSVNSPGDLIAEEWWDGRSRKILEGQINQGDLVDGTNQVSIGIMKVDGVSAQVIYFDWIEVDYQRSFQAIGNSLAFGGDQAGAWRYPVFGFTDPEIAVFEIGNPLAPLRIVNGAVSGSNPYTVTFERTHQEGARFIAAGASAYKTPKEITTYSPDDLVSPFNGADYIIITHADFLTASQELADYRASQGLRTRVVNIEDVYNQFSGGIFNPAAIRNFLEYAFANWAPPAPAYVVLVGDGHWNFHGDAIATYGEPRPIYLPPYLVWADPWQGEVDSTNLLAAFVGEDVIPDVLISRIPVDSAAQLAVVTAKIIQFEQLGGVEWQRRAVFVADNADNSGSFNLESDATIQASMPDYVTIDRYYLDDYPDCPITPPEGYPISKSLCPELTDALTTTLNTSGALFVNYVGHGKDFVWSGERLLHKDELDGLINSEMNPVFVDMTCLTGYYYHAKYPAEFSISAELLRTAGKGAVGTFSPTGLGVATGHSTLNEGFYQALYSEDVGILGLAALAGKLDLYLEAYNFDLIHTFTIFGDPALVLPTGPAYMPQLVVDPVEQTGLPGEQIEFSLEVTNAGVFTDSIQMQLTNAEWLTVLSTEYLANMLPGETRMVNLSVQIPDGAYGGEFDQLSVHAVSQSEPLRYDSQVLLTQVPVIYDGSISPPNPTRFGIPGETLEYYLEVTNSGTMPDTYQLSLAGASWQSSLSTGSLDLLPSSSEFIIVSVDVPVDAIEGDQDQVVLQVYSLESDAYVEDVTITSSAVLDIRALFLPMARRDMISP